MDEFENNKKKLMAAQDSLLATQVSDGTFYCRSGHFHKCNVSWWIIFSKFSGFLPYMHTCFHVLYIYLHVLILQNAQTFSLLQYLFIYLFMVIQSVQKDMLPNKGDDWVRYLIIFLDIGKEIVSVVLFCLKGVSYLNQVSNVNKVWLQLDN